MTVNSESLNNDHTRCWVLLLALLFVPLSSSADEAPSAQALLQSMVQAMQQMSYSGTFVYVRPGRIETMHIAHARKPDGIYERLTMLNGPRREVVRTPQGTSCYLPDRKRVMVNHRPNTNSLISGFPEDIQALENYYRFEKGEPQRIADQDTYQVALLPKDDQRYGRLFWIAQESYLPLKYELIDEHGRMIERMLFTTLVLKEPDEDALRVSVDVSDFERRVYPSQSDQLSGYVLRWQLSHLPNGFKLMTHEQRHLMGDEAVEHMLLSDGVASVSVYISKNAPDQPGLSYGSHLGAVHVFKSVQDGSQITVLGEVPQATVQSIGHNLIQTPSDD